MLIVEKPGPEPTVFGRLQSTDPRDANHSMRKATRSWKAPAVLQRHWLTGWNAPLDQGSTPQCVAFAGMHRLQAAPMMARKTRILPTTQQQYDGAQANDEWDGNNYDGTSARGWCRWMQKQGQIGEYVWAQRVEDIRDFVLVEGPVMIGTDWYERMSEPIDIKGALFLDPFGTYQGGHETLVVGYSRVRHAFRILNSWGKGYGENGRVWCSYDTMNTLVFQMSGDAVSITEREVRA